MAKKKKSHSGRLADLKKRDLVKLVRQGVTDARIGKEYGVSRQAVHQLRKKLGVDARTERNEARNAKIVAMYNKGVPGTKIAKKFGLSVSQAYRILANA